MSSRHASRPRAPPTPTLAERYDALQSRLLHEDGFSRESRVERVLEGLGFDAEARARPLASFSGGWLMRVELGEAAARGPRGAAARRAHQSPRPAFARVVRRDAGGVPRRGGGGLPRSRLPAASRRARRRAAGWPPHALSGRLGLLPGGARTPARAGRGGARGAGSQGRRDGAFHRALPRQGLEGTAGAEPGEGARQARARPGTAPGRAQAAPHDPGARAGRRRAARAARRAQGLRRAGDLPRASTSSSGAARSWRWSDRTAPASRRCCACWRACCPSSAASGGSATRCRWPSTPSTSSMRSIRVAACSRSWTAAPRSKTSPGCAATSGPSCSRATTSRRRFQSCRAARRQGSHWPSCCYGPPTCSCSTSPPITST